MQPSFRPVLTVFLGDGTRGNAESLCFSSRADDIIHIHRLWP